MNQPFTIIDKQDVTISTMDEEYLSRETQSELESWRSSKAQISEETLRRIRRLIKQAQMDMDNLDREISQTPQSVQSLEEQKKIEVDRIAILCSAVSALRKMPSDIIIKIFLHCGDLRMLRFPRGENGYPWILGHICSAWREILWSLRSIWNDIYIFDQTLGSSRSERNTTRDPAIRDALDHILSCTTNLTTATIWGEKASLTWDVLVAHNHKFSSLNFRDVGKETLVSLLTLPPSSFTNVHTLFISVDSLHDFPNLDTSLVNDFRSLQTVIVHCNKRSHLTQLPPLPWNQLTELRIKDCEFPPQAIYNTLRRCSALVSCEFRISDGSTILAEEAILLPSLVFLKLTAGGSFDWNNFLRAITTPALTEMRITSPRVPLQLLSSFITRSNCHLQDLFLLTYGMAYIESDLGLLLRQLPSLVSIYTTSVTPPHIFDELRNELLSLPSLEVSRWVVYPEGLWELLNYIVSGLNTQRHIEVVCHEGAGFEDVKRYYLERYGVFQGIEGLTFKLYEDHKLAPRLIRPKLKKGEIETELHSEEDFDEYDRMEAEGDFDDLDEFGVEGEEDEDEEHLYPGIAFWPV